MKHKFRAGVNLGGWISQYQEFDYAHFDTFIVESDLQKIAAWGFDHVRLPVDYPVIEAAESPGTLDVRGIAYLDRCLAWCQRAGLGLILDLHEAPGYTFTNTLEAGPQKPNNLFQDETLQARFMALWEAITRRYAGQGTDWLAFELLNEVAIPDSAPWNSLARQTLARLRQLDPHRWIVLGGNNYNAVDELKNIESPDDPRLLHTFHFYRPMLVTHQRAPWVKELALYGREVPYPGKAPGLAEFLDQNPNYKPKYETFIDVDMDKASVRAALQPAVDFLQERGLPLYCGEFGVINRAQLQTRLNWTRDFIELLNEFQIGRAFWSYKEMDFGLVDKNGIVVSEDLVKVAAQ